MHPMNRLITFICLFISVHLTAQHEMSLFLANHLNQSQRVNPAHIQPHKFNIALPNVGLDYYNSSFRLIDFFRKEGSTWNVEPEEAILDLENTNNIVGQHTRFETLSLAIKFGKWQLTGAHSLNLETHASYPKNLLEFAWYGNGAYVGDSLSVGPGFDMSSYHEWMLGVAYQANEKWSFGTNIKLLVGLFSIETMRSNVSVYTDPDYYQLTTNTDILVYTSGLGSGLLTGDGDSDTFVFTEPAELVVRRNLGLAVDLGAAYKYNDQWTFSASVTNLGAINWQDTTYQHTSKGRYTFDGVDANPFNSDADIDFEEVIDTIEQTFEFEEMGQTFSTPLSPSFFFHANYKTSNGYDVGGMLSGRWYNGQFAPAIAINAKRKLGKHLNIGAFLGYRTMTGGNLGFHADVNFGGFQAYFVTDDLFTILLPDYGRGTNIRMGINICLGRKGAKNEEVVDSSTGKDLSKENKDKKVIDSFFNRKN